MDGPVPRAPRGRRVPWALVPVALGLLYAVAWGLLRKSPSLEGMVPEDAFVTWWWRDLAAYDEARTSRPQADGAPTFPASALLGSAVNLPNLPGIARDRPIVEAWLDPVRRPDFAYWVLPVASEHAVEKAFRDPTLEVRHARHVVVHGHWAAAAWDLDAARGAGRGFGLLPPAVTTAGDTGLWSVTADWPRLVDFAVQPHVADTPPWAGALKALGFEPGSAAPVKGSEGAQYQVKGGRVPLVRDSWTRVTLRRFTDAAGVGGLELVLLPTPGSELAGSLAAYAREPAAPERAMPRLPLRSPAFQVRIPSGSARGVLWRALACAGVAWPARAAEGDFASLKTREPAGLAFGAVRSPGLLPAWTWVFRGVPAALPDLAAFGLPTAPEDGVVPLPEGAAPLAMPHGGRSPAADVARRTSTDGHATVAFGLAAATTALEAATPTDADSSPRTGAPPGALLAWIEARAEEIEPLLGRSGEPGALFSALLGSRELLVDDRSPPRILTIWVTTDGERLVVRAVVPY